MSLIGCSLDWIVSFWRVILLVWVVLGRMIVVFLILSLLFWVIIVGFFFFEKWCDEVVVDIVIVVIGVVGFFIVNVEVVVFKGFV